jgi:hypothetical protein
MIRLYKFLLFFTVFFLITSCSTKLSDYQETTPSFDIQSYFNGNIIAWGLVQDHTNKVNRRFCVEIEGKWQGNNGVLAEKFYFDDGEISYRNWQLIKQLDGSYKGTAEDVEGIAIGKHSGFAFQFNYTLNLKLEDDSYQIAMDDWMYQLDEYRVMNITSMKKFGIEVAKVTLFIDKEVAAKQCQ